MTEDETVGWHHRLNGHGFGWTLGVGEGQGGLVCCDLWGCKEPDTTERLNRTEHRQDFCVANETIIDFFFSVIPFFFPYDPTDVSNLISSSSAFSKSSLYFWKFSVHVLLKPSLRILKMTLLA